MIKIDLHDFYPSEPKWSFIYVPEDVYATLREFKRKEVAHQVKEFRYKAYFSLDAQYGIESEILNRCETPAEIFEREQEVEMLYTLISSLPEKQAQRVYAHYILGKSISEIARLEGTHRKSVSESIGRALVSLRKIFEKN